MAMQTLTRLFDRHDDAAAVVRSLETAGISHDDISIVANGGSTGGTTGHVVGTTEDEAGAADAGAGATLGTVLGGGAGLLAGIGAMAIPGVGPVVAAGWLIATLTGAGVGAAVGGSVGGLVGALTRAGVSEHDAHVYAEGVRRGGALVTVRVDDSRVLEASAILDGRTPVDVTARRAEYVQTGWQRFDETAPAYAAPTTDAMRPSPGVTAVPETTSRL